MKRRELSFPSFVLKLLIMILYILLQAAHFDNDNTTIEFALESITIVLVIVIIAGVANLLYKDNEV